MTREQGIWLFGALSVLGLLVCKVVMMVMRELVHDDSVGVCWVEDEVRSKVAWCLVLGVGLIG